MSILYYFIDEETRKLRPEAAHKVVAQKDHNADVIRVGIPETMDSVDLETSAVRCMYQRPKETEVRSKTAAYYDTSGGYLWYDWTLQEGDTAKAGKINFSVCLQHIEDGLLTVDWNTTIGEIFVKTSYHSDDGDEGDETITPTVAQRVAVLESMIQRVASGAPIVVSSVSAMVDEEKIYVLTTDKKWYYYDGSAWVAGGEYGAVSTDTTLTQPGMPADAKAVGDEITAIKADLASNVNDLKSALRQSFNELFRVSGYLNQNYVKGRQRYVDAGVEKFANNSRWISPAQGEYIELKSGDTIVVDRFDRYHFRVCYSTDNKVTWTMSSEQVNRFSMPSDAVGWISIIPTTTATDEDVETILNEHVIEIIRNGVNLVGSANANVNGVMDALNISPNSGFQIEAIKNGTTFNYVNTTATENGGTEKLFEVPCAKDDVFRIKFDFQAMVMPENFSDYYLMVREINENESSPLRSVAYKLSELQTASDFTVCYTNTKKIIANVNLKRSSITVSSSYYEKIKYAITVIKVLEQNDVYTEAGEVWEV